MPYCTNLASMTLDKLNNSPSKNLQPHCAGRVQNRIHTQKKETRQRSLLLMYHSRAWKPLKKDTLLWTKLVSPPRMSSKYPFRQLVLLVWARVTLFNSTLNRYAVPSCMKLNLRDQCTMGLKLFLEKQSYFIIMMVYFHNILWNIYS